jgi:hypothetical protein
MANTHFRVTTVSGNRDLEGKDVRIAKWRESRYRSDADWDDFVEQSRFREGPVP